MRQDNMSPVIQQHLATFRNFVTIKMFNPNSALLFLLFQCSQEGLRPHVQALGCNEVLEIIAYGGKSMQKKLSITGGK